MRTLLLILMATSCVLAQDGVEGTIVRPPTVHPDRTVTLRWSAPKASAVVIAKIAAVGAVLAPQ